MKYKKRTSVVAIAGLAGLGWSVAVMADAADEQSSSLAEIVVTAQKRTEKAVDVPIAITALSSTMLQTAGITDMGELAAAVPGMHVDFTGPFYQPSIRGVGTAVAAQGVSPSVATYLDGIYQPNPLANNFDFFDVDSIDVLKGPQGTLFGRNTTAGAILVTTKGPTFDPQFQARIGYGSFNTGEVAMFASGGLTDTLAASVAAGGNYSDGWIKNVANDSDANQSNNYLVRAKVLFQPRDGMKFTLALDSERTHDPTGFAGGTLNGWSAGPALFGIPSMSNDRSNILIQPGTYNHVLAGYGVMLKSELDLNFANLTSYTSAHYDGGHETSNQSASLFPPNGTLPVQPCPTLATCSYLATGGYSFLDYVSWRDWENTYTQEFDLNSKPGGPFDWVAGLYYFYDRTVYSPERLGLYGPFGPGGALSGALPPWPAGSFVQNEFTYINEAGAIGESASFFTDGTYNLGDWHFTAGGRFNWDRPAVIFSAPANLANNFVDYPYLSAGKDYYSFTPRAVLRYSITPDSNAYISWSRGEKSGVYDATGYASERDPIRPEWVTDAEAGYKIATPNTQFEGSAFHYDYTDLQVATYDNGLALIQNAPRSEMWGGDLHLQQRVTQNFRVDLGVAYTHARYLDFRDAAYQAFSPLSGVLNLSANVSGRPMERTPAVTATLGGTYTHPMFGGIGELNATYYHQTSASFDFASSIVQSGYGLLSIRGAWTDPSGHWTLSAIGRNLTNSTYLTGVLPNSGGFGAVYGMPPNYLVEITYKH
jgi:iron complex outermembrane receptor protein